MQLYSSIASFIFTMIFFIQNYAWATGVVPTNHFHEVLEKTVKEYNSLNDTQKRDFFLNAMKSRPKVDRDFVKNNVGDLSKFVFPNIKFHDGEIVFSHQKKQYSFMLKPDFVFVIHDQEIDFGPGKMEKAYYALEKILNQKHVDVFSLFFENAHAIAFPVVMLLIILGVATAMFSLIGTYQNGFQKSLEVVCVDLRAKVDLLNDSSSKEDRIKVKKALIRTRDDIMKVKCGSFAHSSGEDKLSKACNMFRRCLENLSQEIETSLNAVSNEDRSSIKEVNQKGKISSKNLKTSPQ